MPDMWVDVDTAVIVPVNLLPLLDDTDFKSIETAVVYNSAGLALTWNFVTAAGVVTGVAVTPTTGGAYDWSEPVADKGMYAIEIPASGGASINNDTEGVGWFTGVATGVLPWRGPTIGFRRAALNDLFMDGGTASTNMEDFFDGTGYAGGTARLKVDVDTIKTQAVTCGAGVTVRADVGAAAAPGAANGMLIAGSNTATTFANLTVSGTSALGAVTGTTAAFSGALTAASATLSGTLQAATIASTGATTLNSLVVSTTTTLTGVVTATAGIVANITGNITGTLATVTAVTNTVAANLTQILGTALTETAGQIAGAFKKWFDVATPTGTVNSIPNVAPGGAGGLMISGSNSGTTTLAALSITGQLDAGNVLVDTTTVLTGAVTTGAVTKASESITGQWDAGNVLVDGTTTLTGVVNAPAANTIAGTLATVTTVTTATNVTTVNGIANGAITAAAIADGAIDNATFAADVGSTAIGTNIIGIAAKKGVVDALNVDTYAEPGQGAPAATTTLIQKIGYLYKAWRNKTTQTATTYTLYGDGDAITDQKATVSDDGATFTRTKIITGA